MAEYGLVYVRAGNYLRAGASACSLAYCRGGSHVCRRRPDEAFHMIEGRLDRQLDVLTLSSWSPLRSSTGARRQRPSFRSMGISCGALRCTYRSQAISTSTDFSLQIVDNAVSRQTLRRRSRGAVAVRQLPVDLHFGLGNHPRFRCVRLSGRLSCQVVRLMYHARMTFVAAPKYRSSNYHRCQRSKQSRRVRFPVRPFTCLRHSCVRSASDIQIGTL